MLFPWEGSINVASLFFQELILSCSGVPISPCWQIKTFKCTSKIQQTPLTYVTIKSCGKERVLGHRLMLIHLVFLSLSLYSWTNTMKPWRNSEHKFRFLGFSSSFSLFLSFPPSVSVSLCVSQIIYILHLLHIYQAQEQKHYILLRDSGGIFSVANAPTRLPFSPIGKSHAIGMSFCLETSLCHIIPLYPHSMFLLSLF